MAAVTSEAKPKVLIVDDEPDVLAALRRALWNQGYEIFQQQNPKDAVTVLQNEEIDVLISDIDMPQMNGLVLMRTAREICPSAVRVLCTGAGSIENATKAINEGEVHRFVHKPFEPTVLRKIIAEAVQRKKELATATEAGRAAERRRLLMEQLEQEHPGVTQVDRNTTGAYVIDMAQARALAPLVGLEPFFTRR